MTTLLNNPGFVTALVALIAALAGYVRQHTESARHTAQLAALQRQADRSSEALSTPAAPAPTATTVVVPPGAGTVHIESAPPGLPLQAPAVDPVPPPSGPAS
jgi:hypothetical protein